MGALCGITSSNSKVEDVILGLSCCNQPKFGKVKEKKDHWNIYVDSCGVFFNFFFC